MRETQIDRIVHAINKITALVTSGSIAATDTEDTQSITGTSMVLTHTPAFIYGVYMNGQRLTLTTDYTVAADTITFGFALAADSVTVVYKY